MAPLVTSFLVLYFCNLFGFALLYGLGIYNYTIFQTVLVTVSNWPVSPIVRNTLMLAWMLVPLSIILYPVAIRVLKISLQKFLYMQLIFLAIIFISLLALIG